ncbi:MAG: sugar phosphate isomerase/epimerase [Chitinophagaceae bacterium]|nr:sugar phosphate isomerase/epimerase [Chitinophagaceae bacterium]
MSLNRRNFIRTTAAAAVAASLPNSLMACADESGAKLKEFGLQLYTIRDVLPKDPAGTLKQVAGMGYKQVESFEGAEGMFWGMTNVEFKKLMDDLGMKIISSHTNIRKDFEKKAADAAAIGMKYLIDPWEGPQKSIDDFKKIADTFNDRGKICRKNGIRFGYHNHDYPFVPVDGQLPLDVMIQNTDPELVDFEMDIYWVVTAGQDPIHWLNKYPGRFKLSHIKDRKKNEPLSDKGETCILGTGEIDFKKILKDGSEKGFKYYIVEQEQYDSKGSMNAAKMDADYLKKFRF